MRLLNFRPKKGNKKLIRSAMRVKGGRSIHVKHAKKKRDEHIKKSHNKKFTSPAEKHVETSRWWRFWFARRAGKKPAEPATELHGIESVIENNDPSKNDIKNAKGLGVRLEQLEKSSLKNADATNKSVASVRELLLQLKKDVDEIKEENRIFHGRPEGKKNVKEEPDIGAVQEIEAEEFGPHVPGTARPVREGTTSGEAADIAETVYGSGRKIETSLDTLYDLIGKKGAIRITDAAKTMHTSAAQVEEWAHVLEAHNLVEIHYPAVGRPVLKVKK